MRTDTPLTEQQCWRLLARTKVGRLAVIVDGHPDVFPVNFLAKDRQIFFRSAPGSKLSGLAASPTIAFEADGRRLTYRWSVVIKGTAHRLDRDDEIEASGIQSLGTASGGVKWNYVRIDAESITGRRL